MRFSIITVNLNNKEGLIRTINSVISQTFQDFEFIVIDGGSTDGSRDVLEKYDKQISYWVSEKDGGIFNGMNKGIRIAKGEYLNFLNSGDTLFDNNVLSLANKEADDIDILIGKDYHYDEISKKEFSSILPTRISMVTFFMETLPHQGAFIKKKLFSDTPYDETLKLSSDWAFYIKKIIIQCCSVKLVPFIFSQREQNGITCTQVQELKEEKNIYLHKLLPNGVYKDYETLANLDRSTLYKLMNICENPKTCTLLRICIKIINRLFLR